MKSSVYRTKLTRNIQTRVARQLGVSPCHVSLVANGHRTSARVDRALTQEYARIEREVLRFERRTQEIAA